MTRRIPTILGFGIAGLVIAVVTGWRAPVLFYLAPGSEPGGKLFGKIVSSSRTRMCAR